MGPFRMRMKWRASFYGSVWRKGVVCIFLLTRRGVWSKFPGGSGERVQCHNPPYPRSRCGPINRYPPWQFESLLAQNLVPAAGVLTVGGGEGCEAGSQFFEEVTSFEPTCMNTTSEVTSVVFKTGFEPACMNRTSKVTSAVSVLHRLSEDISDSSSNSDGDCDVDPP